MATIALTLDLRFGNRASARDGDAEPGRRFTQAQITFTDARRAARTRQRRACYSIEEVRWQADVEAAQFD